MFNFLGYFGSLLFCFCGLPEVIRCFRDKKCYLSWITLLMWFTGEICLLLYILQKFDMPLFLNYSFNAILVGIMLFYKKNLKNMQFQILQGANKKDSPVVGSDDAVIFFDLADRNMKVVSANGAPKAIGSNWQKFTLNYSDFSQTSGGTNYTLSIGSNLIPAGGLVRGVKVKHNTQFSAATLVSAATLTILDESGTAHISAFNVVQAVGATVGAYTNGANSSTVIPNHSTASNVRAQLAIAGTVGVSVLSALTQGSADVWLDIQTVL